VGNEVMGDHHVPGPESVEAGACSACVEVVRWTARLAR